MTNPLIDSLTTIVAERPQDLPLREHLAELLIADGRGAEAVPHLGVVLASQPSNERAVALMRQAIGAPHMPLSTSGEEAADAPETGPGNSPESGAPFDAPETQNREAADERRPADNTVEEATAQDSEDFDWDSAEQQVGGPAPAFLQGSEPELNDGTDGGKDGVWEVEASTVTLADVGGMQAVKDRLAMAFLAPLRNPEMRRLYGKSLKGGLMLYGPPGCGKTYIARALAGEMGASFMNITLTDILDQYIGNSEANLHSLFETARAHAPVVLFLDEIDAIGQKRSQSTSSGWRGVTNQLLTEMDGIDGTNEGSLSWPPRMSPGTWIRRCAGPVASIGPLRCCPRMNPPGTRSSITTCGHVPWRGSTWHSWRARPPVSRARTWRTWQTAPSSTR